MARLTEQEEAERTYDRMDDRIRHLTGRCEQLDAENKRLTGYAEQIVEQNKEEIEGLRVERDQWRAERLPDREAEMISGCVRAIDRYHQQMRAAHAGPRANTDFVSVATGWSRTGSGWQQPEALGDPVGRALLALAARYGLAIEAVPATVPTRDDARELADAVGRILNEFGSRPR